LNKAEALRQVIRDNSERNFQYGEWDCCQFVCNLIEAATGKNPALEYTYCSESGAYRYIDQSNGLGNIASRALGEPVGKDELTIGDIALLKLPKVGEVLGAICHDGAACVTEAGFLKAHMKYVKYGWVL